MADGRGTETASGREAVEVVSQGLPTWNRIESGGSFAGSRSLGRSDEAMRLMADGRGSDTASGREAVTVVSRQGLEPRTR